MVERVKSSKEICKGQSHSQEEMIDLGEKDSQDSTVMWRKAGSQASVVPEGRKNIIREHYLVIKKLCSVSYIHKSIHKCGSRVPKCQELHLIPHLSSAPDT